MEVIDDDKIIYYTGDSYRILLKGTDSGIMDYIIEELDEELNVIRTVEFNNLLLEEKNAICGHNIRSEESRHVVEIDPKELTTVLTKPETDINESIKDATRKEYDNDGEMMPVLEAEDGSLIGLDDNDEAYYVEITEASDPDAAIAGVHIGDDVHQAADKFRQAGAVEDVQAEQYWAELFFNDGQPNIYILCFNYAVPDSGKMIAYMATIDRDTVIGVSAEVK